MRIRTLALVAVGLAACSAPQQTQPPVSRDLHLGTTAPHDTGVVSEIEIGRLPKARTPSPGARSHVAAAALEAPAPRLAMASTSAALIEPTHDFKDAPEPIEILVAGPAPAAMPGTGLAIGLQRGGMGEGGWSTGGRRGGVIIRGGMGGTDDDCDIRHPHSSPIAIHSLTPGFRGGIH